MVLDKILSNLCNLHDMKQLNLPVPIMRKLFQRAKSHFKLPEWDGETVLKNMNICPATYDSQFVVQYQHTKDIFTSPPYLVENFFVIEGSNESVKMCLECMKIETGKRLYYKIYRHVPSDTCNDFVTDAWNWCHVCKCFPLFQTFSSFRDICKQFGPCHYILLPDWIHLKDECFKDDAVQKDRNFLSHIIQFGKHYAIVLFLMYCIFFIYSLCILYLFI